MTATGHDDAQTVCEHVWALMGIHLVLGGDHQVEEECTVCATVRLRVGGGYQQMPVSE